MRLALVGPTASGKTRAAISLAERIGQVELMSMDSMAVYRGMDIGTAKPSPEELAGTPMHLLDLVDPWEEFTLREFQGAAFEALEDIAGRGSHAFMVGGTGLYLHAVVDRLDLPERFPVVAALLQEQADLPGGLPRLYDRLVEADPIAASRIQPGNRRRIIRALEVTLGSGRPFSSYGPGVATFPPTDVVMVGIRFDPSVHDPLIEERFGQMMKSGLLEEVRRLAGTEGGMSRTARQALGYRELLAHIEDGVPLAEASSRAVDRTRAFARRQWAWFRRDPRITWMDPASDVPGFISELLADRIGAASGC